MIPTTSYPNTAGNGGQSGYKPVLAMISAKLSPKPSTLTRIPSLGHLGLSKSTRAKALSGLPNFWR